MTRGAQLRVVWFAFVAYLVIFLVVVIVVTGRLGSFAVWPEGVLALGGALVVWVVRRVRDVPVDASDNLTLASGYRGRFFVALAVADAPGIVGLAAALLTDETAPMLAVLPFSIAALLAVAPTDAQLQAYDATLRTRGSGLSLADGLREPITRRV